MATPILSTKLYIPPVRPELVPRPRLIERLNTGATRKLTLVSAPAGFGKTTLLSEWTHRRGEVTLPVPAPLQVAWLSLDQGDNDLNCFLTYCVAALQTIKDNVGQGVLAGLQSSGAVNTELVLTTLLNEIAGLKDDFTLLLDDYHVIESPAIDKALGFLLDHLPPQMHLGLITRTDPTLPLSRLRARGQLTELRADDLRFTTDEAAVFLKQVIHLPISSDDVRTLENRTEGWITGLQLAAVAMQGLEQREQIARFIHSFGGSHRYIIDYLVDEVLDQQTPQVQEFLLQTSILDRLVAPLCNVVTSRKDSQAILERLDAANLFLIPLDGERRWYRYHHLFAELLHHRLRQSNPEQIEELHARASHWLDDNGLTHQAIKHALAIDDKYFAADLLERHAKTLLYQGHAQVQNMRDWFKLFPQELIQERPLLSIFHTWVLVFENPIGNCDEVERILAQTQQSLDKVDSDGTGEKIVAGHIASIRALLSQPPIQTDHDPHAVLELLHKAQSLLPPSEIETRSDNSINIGYEYMHLADTKAALKANKAAFAQAQVGNNHLVAIVSIRNQALIAYYLGGLDQAVEICQNGIASFDQLCTEKDQPSPNLGILFIMVGHLLIERGELEKAEVELGKGFDLLQWFGEYEALALGLVALTRLLLLKGDSTSALQIGERFGRHWSTCAALLETLRIQAELSRFEGDSAALETILSWRQENQPKFEAESDFPGISPWNETQHLAHLTWIQSQIALARLESESPQQPVLQSCLDYLDRRLQVAQQRGLVFRIIECSVLKTLVLDVLGNTEKAVVTLSQALSLAEPKGFRRVFLDKGQPMIRLLLRVSEHTKSTDFAHQLLTALERPKDVKTQPFPQNLIEPLSKRELQVLQLIAQGLSNREISERLFLALTTVKGHNRRIYGKLGVKNRAQAINKAISLHILPPQ
ncbi:MAG: hypothetical protein GY832_21455 [Chloroflexi bacterium]|nr:hypothetical protein [Chloroflexota bacterium]